MAGATDATGDGALLGGDAGFLLPGFGLDGLGLPLGLGVSGGFGCEGAGPHLGPDGPRGELGLDGAPKVVLGTPPMEDPLVATLDVTSSTTGVDSSSTTVRTMVLCKECVSTLPSSYEI